MWRASLLLAAVRADFDADLVAAGQRGPVSYTHLTLPTTD